MSDVADIRSRYRFWPDSLVRAAEVLGLDLDETAPKWFSFHQRIATERVTDASGFNVRARGADGVHRWKVTRRGYVEIQMHIGGVMVNIGHIEKAEPATMREAKRWAYEFAEKHGFEARYQPTGAEATRGKPKAKVLAFTNAPSDIRVKE